MGGCAVTAVAACSSRGRGSVVRDRQVRNQLLVLPGVRRCFREPLPHCSTQMAKGLTRPPSRPDNGVGEPVHMGERAAEAPYRSDDVTQCGKHVGVDPLWRHERVDHGDDVRGHSPGGSPVQRRPGPSYRLLGVRNRTSTPTGGSHALDCWIEPGSGPLSWMFEAPTPCAESLRRSSRPSRRHINLRGLAVTTDWISHRQRACYAAHSGERHSSRPSRMPAIALDPVRVERIRLSFMW